MLSEREEQIAASLSTWARWTKRSRIRRSLVQGVRRRAPVVGPAQAAASDSGVG